LSDDLKGESRRFKPTLGSDPDGYYGTISEMRSSQAFRCAFSSVERW
jgi:hypothetical protein